MKWRVGDLAGGEVVGVGGENGTDTGGYRATSTQVAAAAVFGNSFAWLLGVFAIAAFAGMALFLAKRLGKNEWDIEEMGETG